VTRALAPLLLVVLTTLASGEARAQNGREDLGHHYALEARLNPESHTVEGVARIRWRNDSRADARSLILHLYLNAFASDDTVFMQGSGGESRGNEASGEGSITLLSLETSDGHDLLAGADDELVPDDHTQLRVTLPTPVAPGEDVVIEATFRSVLPPVFARAGYHGSFHAVTQWFPKVARLEEFGAWRSFPYHPHGEFYADFARYELEVDVPEGFVVGATGRQVSETREDGRVIRRFEAEPVHDVAFVAWDRFEEVSFEASGVAVRMLHPPGYERTLALHQSTVEAGLAHFGSLLGAYAYDYLTVIVPPRGAEGAAGMEYPTLFLTAGPPYPMTAFPVGGQEAVTAHELGHMWFQGMVATDEVRFPFLDEGLTQWITGDLLRRTRGHRHSGIAWPFAVDFFQIMRVASFRGDHDRPPAAHVASFHGREYGRSVYTRTSTVLETVRRTWGRRRFEAALGAYAREQRFAHPTPEDLYATFDRHYYAGFADEVLRPALAEGGSAALELRAMSSREADEGWVTDILALRRGSVALPTTVELRYDGGETERIPWPAEEDTLSIHHRSASEVLSARVDPDAHNLLDPTFADRQRGFEARSSPFGWLLHLAAQLASWVVA